MLNRAEEESVFLISVVEAIDEMVNKNILVIYRDDPDSETRFQSSTHQRIFNILLVDFLSETDSDAPVNSKTYLSALRSIAANPCFETDNSADRLRESVNGFTSWLECKIKVPVWIPAIETETELDMMRLKVIKMSGNISKHNVLRSAGIAKKLQQVLSDAGHEVDIEDALLAMSDVYNKFYNDFFNYHGSTIAEFLNNIRWGIHEYLIPEYNRSYTEGDNFEGDYSFDVPESITSRYARECYWDLLNSVRSKPYISPFTVTQNLKQRY